MFYIYRPLVAPSVSEFGAYENSIGCETVPRSWGELRTVNRGRRALDQNYPNPLNPETAICYQLPATNSVSLIVFGVLGRKVSVLASKRQTAATYTVRWDGSGCPSGVYFYRLQTGDFVQTKKMVLVK